MTPKPIPDINNADSSLWKVWVHLGQQLLSVLGGTRVRLGPAGAWKEEQEGTAAENGSCLKQPCHGAPGAGDITSRPPSRSRTCLAPAQPGETGMLPLAPGDAVDGKPRRGTTTLVRAAPLELRPG